MTGTVILNVAVGGDYPLGQRRLGKSLDGVGDGSMRLFFDRWPGQSHSACPGGFKIVAFETADQMGFTRALWLDAQVVARKPLAAIWALFDRMPVILVEDPPWNLGEWTGDDALEIFGVGRDELMDVPTCWTKIVGIDLGTERGREFLDGWRALRDVGAFDGPWHDDSTPVSTDPRVRGHRHDQTCASWLAYDMGIKMLSKAGIIGSWPTIDDPVFLVKAIGGDA